MYEVSLDNLSVVTQVHLGTQNEEIDGNSKYKASMVMLPNQTGNSACFTDGDVFFLFVKFKSGYFFAKSFWCVKLLNQSS